MLEFEDSFKFNSVVVLESLPPRDFRTGTELYEQVLVPAAHANQASVVLHNVPNVAAFRNVLNELIRAASTGDVRPILHIEAHGAPGEGIVLADSQLIRWEELFADLARLNLATRFNLLVVVSACWGVDLVGILRPDRPSPVWGLIGPSKEIPAIDLLRAFKAFYDNLLTSFDGVAAIKAMRAASEQSRQLSFLPAEVIFRAVFARYVLEHCEGKHLEERVSSIFAAIVEANPGELENEAAARAWLRERIDDHDSHFERLKPIYFMYEDIPENRQRVKCRYSDGPPAAYAKYLKTQENAT